MRVLPWCLPVFMFAGSIAFAQSPPIPDQQQKFVSIVDDFAGQYRTAPNDMARGTLRPKRAKALCGFMQNPQVNNWVGTVMRLDSAKDGAGVMAVLLGGKNVHAVLDVQIEPGSPVHDAAIQLKEKQRVVFSGEFVPDAKDCFFQADSEDRGAMTGPGWAFIFSSVKPAE